MHQPPNPQQPPYGPQQPPYGGGPHPSHYGPPQAPPPRKGPNVGVIVAIVAGAVLLVLLLVVGIGGFVYMTNDDTEGGRPSAEEPAGGDVLDGVIHHEVPSRDHVPTGERVTYDTHPPAGGDHYSSWQDCGVYDEPVFTEFAVHSQEHGAVWITHDPDLDDGQIETLHDLYSSGDYLVISPMADLPSPVVASGWGTQVHLDDAEDPLLSEYLRQYERSEDVPEPGAPCNGGVSDTETQVEDVLEAEDEDTSGELTEEELEELEELLDELPE